MSVRYARRAKISGEEAATISFGFSSFAIAIIAGVLEELPSRIRAKLTFSDGQVVWHSPLFAWRVRQVAEAVQAGGASA
jgi:hypothetical protein